MRFHRETLEFSKITPYNYLGSNMNSTTACDYVIKRRPEVHLLPTQKRGIEKFEEYLLKSEKI